MCVDGQEFADGPNKAGYVIVFNLLLRIPLTLFGLWFSYLIFEAVIWLLAKTFMPALVSATSTGTFGAIGTVVSITMLCVITHQCAFRSFALITAVPDRVSRWFGATGDNPEDGSTSNVTAVVGNISAGSRQGYGIVESTGKGTLGKLAAAGRGMQEQRNATQTPKTPNAGTLGRSPDNLRRD